MFEPLLILAIVFVSVGVLASLLAWVVLARSSAERKRFQEVTRPTRRRGAQAEVASLLEPGAATADRARRFLRKSPKDLGRLRKRLARAGYYSLTAAAVYSALEVAVPAVFGVTAFVLLGSSKILLVLLAAGVGYVLPGLVLERLIKRRMKAISNGLPDALDLLIVCLEAGSALDQGIVKVTEELAITHPALAEEFRLLNLETRAGKPRIEAFRNLAARTGVEDIRSLVSMLVQTDRFGTSVAQALRVHANTSRTKRRQRAEERAGKVAVKLTFPLVFCLFPALYVVTLGPAIVDFLSFFSHEPSRRETRTRAPPVARRRGKLIRAQRSEMSNTIALVILVVAFALYIARRRARLRRRVARLPAAAGVAGARRPERAQRVEGPLPTPCCRRNSRRPAS